MLIVCFFGGLGFIRYGLKYRDRDKINKEIKEENEYWKKTPWSNGQVIGIIALILFFTSIGIGFVSAYVVKNLSLVGLFLLLLVISVLMAFVSSILVREERRKDREKKMYGHQE
jgi:4-hydroxybenzoate polyprenyltransferase